jgi:uncharacterized protein
MEYFLYCRAKPQAGELWAELTEAHWSFMDAYADAMIARGPTLNEDGTAATGSMHIVDLPNEEDRSNISPGNTASRDESSGVRRS